MRLDARPCMGVPHSEQRLGELQKAGQIEC